VTNTSPAPWWRRPEVWIALLTIAIPALCGWVFRVQAATDRHETAIVRVESRAEGLDKTQRTTDDRLARIETKIDILLDQREARND
jgi:hypothetical protein